MRRRSSSRPRSRNANGDRRGGEDVRTRSQDGPPDQQANRETRLAPADVDAGLVRRAGVLRRRAAGGSTTRSARRARHDEPAPGAGEAEGPGNPHGGRVPGEEETDPRPLNKGDLYEHG